MNEDDLSLSEQKISWEVLLKSDAWVSLVEALQAQTDALQNEILFGPVESTGDAFRIERKKGQLEGRLSITATATAMMEEVETDLRRILQEESGNVEA